MYLPPDPAAVGLNPSTPKFFSEEKIVDVAEANQLRCLQEIGQWLGNVDRIHLVQASCKLVQQKRFEGKH